MSSSPNPSSKRVALTWLRQGTSEHQPLEFKEVKYQFDTRKLGEYCIALANVVLLLGVADMLPRPELFNGNLTNGANDSTKIIQINWLPI